MGQTLPRRLQIRAAQTPDAIAYVHQTQECEWEPLTWGKVHERVDILSNHLVRLGLQPGERVALMLPTSPIWEYCQFAAMAVGAIVVGLDSHDAPRNLQHILNLTRPKLVIAGTGEQLKLISGIWQAPELAITASGEPPLTAGYKLAALFVDDEPEHVASLPTLTPEQTATIVFTSGSTGEPKGIAYSHKQITDACDQILQRFPSIRDDARLVCWLPLSNLFQRMINFCALTCGARSYFVDKPENIAQLLPQIQPTFFIGVPRFFEKLHAGILKEVGKQPALVRTLVDLAWNVGMRAAAAKRTGTQPNLVTRTLLPLADRILAPLRAAMGNNLEFMVSGSAPLPHWLAERLHGLGWLVLEAYGISENVLPVALNTPEQYRIGSVGKPMPTNELRIADDKELLIRGPGVFSGYYGESNEPPPISPDGFLHTGDYARIDEDGYVWLEGRKSEVFKTSTGRRISPSPIEAALKQISYVEHAVIVGRHRPFPLAILALDPQHDVSQKLHDATTADMISTDVAAACAIFTDYQRPGAVIVTTRPFTIATGELTANLKIRRKQIEDRFLSQIDQTYARPTQHRLPVLARLPIIIAP